MRRRLLAEGSLGEAARCTLGLLAVRVGAGRQEGLGALGPELFDAFASPQALPPAEMIDLLAVLAGRSPGRYRGALSATREALAALPRAAGGRPKTGLSRFFEVSALQHQ